MFGRKLGKKLPDLSIVIECQSGDSNRAPDTASGALEVVELSPSLRSAPICWVLSARAMQAGRNDFLTRLRRRMDHFGDVLATSGYAGYPHGALLKSELAQEVRWGISPPDAGVSGTEIDLYMPREPDDRLDSVLDDISVPTFHGYAHLNGTNALLRFSHDDRTVAVPAVVLSNWAATPQQLKSRRTSRRTLRRLISKSAPAPDVFAVVVELEYDEDLAAFRSFADILDSAETGLSIKPISEAMAASTTVGHTTSGVPGRRSADDENLFLTTATVRAQHTAAAAETIRNARAAVDESALVHRDDDPNGVPIRRELAVPMTGQAILEESGLHAVFVEGRLRSIGYRGDVLLDQEQARSWLTIDGTQYDLEMADAISFQNESSRGLRSSFVTPENAPVSAGLLIDALVIDGHPALYLDAYLSFSTAHPTARLDHIVPLSIAIGPLRRGSVDEPAHALRWYPDGEERSMTLEGDLEAQLFGNRFRISAASRVLEVQYLHPTRRYVGEVILRAEPGPRGRLLHARIGPQLRGVPARTVANLCRRFVCAIGAPEFRVPEFQWPSDLGVPGLWTSRRNGEVEG